MLQSGLLCQRSLPQQQDACGGAAAIAPWFSERVVLEAQGRTKILVCFFPLPPAMLF